MLEHQENCRIFGHRVPQYLWFVLSGAICDTIQALLDVSSVDYGVYLGIMDYAANLAARMLSNSFLLSCDTYLGYCPCT
jgi:hypothetical protein